MKTPEEKVAWALRFGRLNLQQLNEKQRTQLRAELQTFVQWSDGTQPARPEAEFTTEALLLLQRETRLSLKTLGFSAFTQAVRPPTQIDRLSARKLRSFLRTTALPRPTTAWYRPLPSIIGLVFVFTPTGGTLHLQADFRDTFFFVLASALVAVDPKKFTVCPECDEPFFVSHGHQRFCSTKCKNRVMLKRFRERKRQEKAKSKRVGKKAR